MASSHADFHADQCSNGIRRLFIAVVLVPMPSQKHGWSLLGVLMLWTWFNFVHHCWEWLVYCLSRHIALCCSASDDSTSGAAVHPMLMVRLLAVSHRRPTRSP
jgi:hypothetical protein